MKIQKALLLLLTGILCLTAAAQDLKCEAALKALEEKVKTKAYDDAASLLPDLRKNCPKQDPKLYVVGEAILKYKIEASRKDEDKKLFTQDLLSLYNEQEKNYPNTGGAIKKAVLLNEQGLVKPDEAYKMLDAAFATGRNAFDYLAIEAYFNLYLKQYEAGTGITQEQFIQKYGDMAAQVAYAQNTIATKRQAITAKEETQPLSDDDKQYLADTKNTEKTLQAVGDNMAKQASKHFNCEKLDAYYTAGYEKNKDNTAWLQGMVTVLDLNKCYKSVPLYNGAIALNKLKPNYNTAYFAGYISQKKNAVKDAIAYYEQAANFEPEPVKKAALYDLIATIYRNSDKAEAKKYALLSAATNAKSAKPYLFLADMYASVTKECGLSDFDKKALLWLALDTLKKAEAAEPKYKATVTSLTEQYSKNLLTKKDLKATKKSKGDEITYGCWINETVTIPKVK